MINNSPQATSFYRSFTTDNVKNIDNIIYTRIPNAKSLEEIDTHLYKLANEIDNFKINIAERGTLIGDVFSPHHASFLRKKNEKYLVVLSQASEESTDVATTNARVFGVWGNDLYSNVAKWGDDTGKLPTSFDADVDVRDLFYNMQDYCRYSSC